MGGPANDNPPVIAAASWWRTRRSELLERLGDRDCAYVYDLATVRARARALTALRSIGRVLYAIKANPHPAILRAVADEGLAFECVSPGEIARVLAAVPGIACDRLLFTPNFAPRAEYRSACEAGVGLTIDNLYALRVWPELFAGRDLFVRIDTGRGRGHHRMVQTAGEQSKFGVPQFELAELRAAAERAGAGIRGLHAHAGSGHFDISGWLEAAAVLAATAAEFPQVRTLNIGGGLGVPDGSEKPAFDLDGLDRALGDFRRSHPAYELWLEPGRFLVAEAGALLARVTQQKGKGAMRYVGVATGMNSLIRPALYGAWHEIVNLTRMDAPATTRCTVVGPICETGDVLGEDRLLPACEEGDVLLIANTGAYGRCMASNYNLRQPAEELLLDPPA